MDFEAFPKIPRLNRDIVVTEKIDGTNTAVLIEGYPSGETHGVLLPNEVALDGRLFSVQAQSRKRLITPESDHFGFARWVRENAEELVRLLGPGRHFGEWWGLGIQRGYGQTHKRFSLFNPARYVHLTEDLGQAARAVDLHVDTVPVLYEGPFHSITIASLVQDLRREGSIAAPGFMDPEGIIIYHSASRGLFKVTCKDDEKPKGSNE